MFLDFYKTKAFGLDISDFSIEALELKKRFRKVYLRTYGRIKLEKGIVVDGKILNKEKLKEKIKEVLDNAVPRKLRAKQVILSLPESKTFLHTFEIPSYLKDDALAAAVEDQAKKTIPLDFSKIYSDFKIISKNKDIQEVLYVGTLKETVDEYLDVLKGAGLTPFVLDIESASLVRAFEQEEVKEGGMLLADIGARTTTLTVFDPVRNKISNGVDKGSIKLSAIVPIAGNHFTKAVSEKLNISLEKAEELKRKNGLDPEKEEGRTMLVLQAVLQDILDEIQKTISFYGEKYKRKIKKILLCGGSSLTPKLSSYFAFNLGISAKIPDPWEGINVEELFKRKELEEVIKTKLHPIFFANVIGLAKRGLEKDPETAGINLIPFEKLHTKPVFIGKKLSKNRKFNFLVVFLFAAAFVFLGWVIYVYIFTPFFLEIPAKEKSSTKISLPVSEEVIEEIPMVIIKETETGWLRVREGPGTIYPEIAKIYPGESYPLLEEIEEWCKIELEDKQEAWISIEYILKQ